MAHNGHWLQSVGDTSLDLGMVDNESVDLYEACKDMEEAIDQRRDFTLALKKLKAAMVRWEERRAFESALSAG